MCLKKTIHRFSLMPPGSIQVKPDRIAPKTTIKMTQHFHEAFSISTVCPNNPVAAQKRCHPTRKIEALLMLASRRDAIRMSSPRPSSSQSRMERESRLILEDDCLPRSQILEFFLTPGEIASHPSPALEGTHNWPSLNDIPVDAARSELVALSSSIRTGVLSVRPEWVRPNELGSGQNPGEIALHDLPLPGQFVASNETAARARGIKDIILKPYSISEIAARIQKVLNKD